MTPSSNPLILLVDIFRSPADCFAALYERGKWAWLPYILLIFAPFMFWGTYFDLVNFEWVTTNLTAQIESIGGQVQGEWLTKEILLAGEVINDVMGRTATILLLALWFKLATKQSQYQHGYFKWVAGSTVVMFPALIGDIASYASLLLNHANIMPYAADLNSLNGLIKLPMTDHWSAYASSFPLLMPWYIALSYAALGAWTDLDRSKALIIAILPWVTCFTLWGFVTAFSG
ncbi:YIP1 family protein [Aliivibrio wodanis]|uniref:Putative membrane protein n=1 Tax=Aliivibrio wodanis TaxID=80852 RepID=A0A090IS15_9GAMM|nr:putative membrane protein [Aliivibrio wodanis]VVV04846.1 hypothetical protein AW0309160_02255 [Aliivibrio wodanis]